MRRGAGAARRIHKGRDVRDEDGSVRPPGDRVPWLTYSLLMSLHATTIGAVPVLTN